MREKGLQLLCIRCCCLVLCYVYEREGGGSLLLRFFLVMVRVAKKQVKWSSEHWKWRRWWWWCGGGSSWIDIKLVGLMHVTFLYKRCFIGISTERADKREKITEWNDDGSWLLDGRCAYVCKQVYKAFSQASYYIQKGQAT